MRARSNGFTLLEMLVVIGIMGLIAGLGFPALQRSIARSEFRAASTGVDLAVRQARAIAIASARTVSVDVPTGGPDLRRSPMAAFRVPARMRLVLPGEGIRFYRDGTSNGGALTLTDGSNTFRLRVDADTGAIGTPV